MKTQDLKMKDALRRMARLGGTLVTLVLTLVATACNSGPGHNGLVGNGNGPAYLIAQSTTAVGEQSFQMFECVRAQVQAILFFQNGSSGDYTSRVTWSSSSPGTVKVSNADPVVDVTPAGGVYAHGVVTPVNAGVAVITASYFGLSATVNVSVQTPSSLTVQQVIEGNRQMIAPLPSVPPLTNEPSIQPVPTTGLTMGTGTTVDLTVTAILDGRDQNIEATGVTWSFLFPNDGEASIVPSTGVITGINDIGGPLIAMVSFDSCPYVAATQVTVGNISSITMETEFTGNPVLVVGNTELIKVMGNFSDPSIPPQDISNVSTFLSSNTGVVGFGFGGAPNIVNAVAQGGPSLVTATFSAGGTLLTASNLKLTTELASFTSFTVTPLEATVRINDIDFAQFRAFGHYVGQNDGAITQEITRQVVWTVSSPTLATIANGNTAPLTAGQALAVGSLPGSLQVTATDGASLAPVVFSSLAVTF